MEKLPEQSELEQFHERLRGAGLLAAGDTPVAAQPTEAFEPITVPGSPLSESIIAERR